MCLAEVVFVSDDARERSDPLIEVAYIERTPGGLRVGDLCGSVTEVDAEIRSIDFMESVVRLQKRARAGGSVTAEAGAVRADSDMHSGRQPGVAQGKPVRARTEPKH